MPLLAAKLRELLVDSGLVPVADFDAAIAAAQKRHKPLDEVILDQNLIPESYFGQMVAEAIGYPYAHLENEKISDYILRIIPERVARQAQVIAFGKGDDGRLKLAMRDPDDLELIRFVEKKMGMRVAPYYATPGAIHAGLERYSHDLDSAIKSILESVPAVKSEVEEGEGPVIRIVELVIAYAYQNNASDVHIEPREKEVVVRYRIDGILHDVVSLPKSYLEPIITRIKIMAKLRTDERLTAQDGKFQDVIDGERIDVRVSVLPIMDGEKAVMRILAEKGRRYGLVDLGFSDPDLKRLQKHIQKSFGMILATGPTGSGKTTTMYAVLKILNTRDVNIATIEDPIEYAIEGVNQIQVNVRTGLTFASGLRSIVRQDPDIIMVGEIRDEETAGIAVNSAMTGHLVLSTLHTNDAATTLPRFRDMKIEPFLIASTINAIIAQRLVRKICARCITSYDANKAELLEQLPEAIVAKIFADRRQDTVKLYVGRGCDRCGDSGYVGRIGIYEILEMEDNVRELIMTDTNAKVIRDQAIKNGMTTMLDDGVLKALAGITTIEEVMRVAGE